MRCSIPRQLCDNPFEAGRKCPTRHPVRVGVWPGRQATNLHLSHFASHCAPAHAAVLRISDVAVHKAESALNRLAKSDISRKLTDFSVRWSREVVPRFGKQPILTQQTKYRQNSGQTTAPPGATNRPIHPPGRGLRRPRVRLRSPCRGHDGCASTKSASASVLLGPYRRHRGNTSETASRKSRPT
jgi:hypothetical protein